MASKAYKEKMKRRWREHREDVLASLASASKASLARSDYDKAIQQWRSARARKRKGTSASDNLKGEQ